MLKPTNNHSTRVSAGLMGWWPLDRSIHNYAGTGIGRTGPGSIFTRGGFGNYFLRCYDRSVGGSVLITPGSANTFAGLKAGSLCAWLFFDVVNTGQQFCFMEATSSAGTTRFGFGYDDGSGNAVLYGRWRDAPNDPGGAGTNVLSSTNPTASTWYHVAVTYDSVAGFAKIYVNGVLDCTPVSVSNPFGTSDTAGQAILSGQDSSIAMSGKMLDMRLYNRALNAAEIKEIYTEPFRTIDSNSIVPGIEPLGWLRQAPSAPAVSAVRRAVYLPKLRDYAPRQMPLGIMPKIKRNHPLAQGLIGCWVPGLTLGIDLSGTCTPLTLSSASTPTWRANPEGLSIQGSTGGTSATGGNGFYTNTVPAAYKNWTKLSMYYRGTRAPVPQNSITQGIGIYCSIAGSPWNLFGIGDFNGNDWNGTGLDWNDGTFEKKSSSPTVSLSLKNDISIGGSLVVNGTNTLYSDGVSQGTASFGAASYNNSADQFGINVWQAQSRYAGCNMYCGYIWNRELSAQEQLWLHVDPYSFLEFDMDRFGWMPGPEGPDISPFRLLGIAEVDI